VAMGVSRGTVASTLSDARHRLAGLLGGPKSYGGNLMSQIVEASQMLVDQTPVSRPPVEQLRRRAEVLRPTARVTVRGRGACHRAAAPQRACWSFVLLPGGPLKRAGGGRASTGSPGLIVP